MADDLLQITYEAGLQLLTPPGTETWEARGAVSTIDLVFATEGLARQLVSCKQDAKLESGSDHHPITTEFTLLAPNKVVRPRRRWKDMDREGVSAGAQHLRPPGTLQTAADIEEYTGYLLGFLDGLIEHTVPKGRPTAGYACPWWTPEVRDAVQTAKLARRRRVSAETLQTALRHKKKVIRRAKTEQFRRDIHEAASAANGIWKLVRWAKTRSHLPPEPPIIPTLRELREGVVVREAHTPQEKAEMLREQFFPEEPDADLSDMEGYTYPPSVEALPQVTAEDVMAVMASQMPHSAPGVDGIPNAFLKALGEPFAVAIAALTQACWEVAYYPKCFRRARTVAIRKPDKDDYSLPSSWRPIALLSTVGKVVEAVTAQQLKRIAEQYNMLPDHQMGARRHRSTETALDLIVNQVREVWQAGDYVASLLSLDIAGAFDRVVKSRLLHVLRAKGVPESLVTWVGAFVSERKTTMVLSDSETDEFAVVAGVPQGSPLSPILFLFYIAELLDLCNSSGERLSASGFVDDTNLLAYGLTTEENCRILARAHGRCMDWARRYGASFSPRKYKLIHLAQKPRRFNMQASLRLEGNETKPSSSVRVLGVWIDPRLSWGPHVKEVLVKMETHTNALMRTTASTWGATFARARQIYTAVVRPALAYGSSVWHSPRGLGSEGGQQGPAGPAAKLARIQNKCLRTVAGAYRATPVPVLETETYVPPLDLHLDEKLARFRSRHKQSGMENLVTAACSNIRRRLIQRARRGDTRTEGERRTQWAEAWLQQGEQRPVMSAWRRRWEAHRHEWGLVGVGPPSGKAVKLHSGLHKAESSVITQIRTGRIGLAAFLNKAQVPDFPSPVCQCGQANETAAHVIVHCPRFAEARRGLIDRGSSMVDLRSLVTKAEGVKRLARWFLRLRILPQFLFAEGLIYREG
jgi:hypothetical protein